MRHRINICYKQIDFNNDLTSLYKNKKKFGIGPLFSFKDVIINDKLLPIKEVEKKCILRKKRIKIYKIQ